MPFALKLPFRGRPGVPQTPRRLRACLREIAQAEPRAAGRRLADLIAAQNQLALARRLQLLEIIRPAVRAPLDALSARVQAQSLPLPQRTRELADLQRELLGTLIDGYETVAAEAGQSRRASGRPLALVAERLLAARAELLLRHIEVQEPLPASFWQQTNAIYARAEAAGAGRRRVSDRHWRGGRRPAAADAFVSLLLLALAHPRGLRPGEGDRIHRATQNWCREARLIDAAAAPADAAERGTVFAVALDAVTAPTQWRQRAGEPRPQERVLDLARVVARVEKLHTRAVAAGRAAGSVSTDDQAIGATGLKRLLDHWNPRPLQRDPETPASAEVVLGLAAIQRRLDATRRRNAGAQRPRQYAHLHENVLQTIAEDGDPGSSPGAGSSAYPHARAAVEHPTAGNARIDTGADDPAAKDSVAGTPWVLEEADAAGFRLRWRGAGSSGATIGELAAVRILGSADNTRWRLGIVRWQQYLDEDHFAIGCELLSPGPLAATLRHEPQNRHRRSAQRDAGEPALLLPGADRCEGATTVLVPAHQFQPQAILELDAGERTLRVQLAALREQSVYFALFELAPAPARGRTSGIPTPTQGHSMAG